MVVLFPYQFSVVFFFISLHMCLARMTLEISCSKKSFVLGYMKPLFDYAIDYVPETKRPYTSVFILATAGMRLLQLELVFFFVF